MGHQHPFVKRDGAKAATLAVSFEHRWMCRWGPSGHCSCVVWVAVGTAAGAAGEPHRLWDPS